jgi:hypothetical protein
VRLSRLGLVAVLLVPCAQASAASGCAVSAPALDADLAAACAAVRAAVPGWDGRGTVRFAEGDPGVAGETVGTTVTLHPAAWARLTPAGRQEVLTHELVHAATSDLGEPPMWLQEGLAESVALEGSGLPDRTVGQELAAARGLHVSLPTAADFERTPAIAYQESWLAVDVLRREHGEAWVLRLYRGEVAPDADLVTRLRAEIVRRLS